MLHLECDYEDGDASGGDDQAEYEEENEDEVIMTTVELVRTGVEMKPGVSMKKAKMAKNLKSVWSSMRALQTMLLKKSHRSSTFYQSVLPMGSFERD